LRSEDVGKDFAATSGTYIKFPIQFSAFTVHQKYTHWNATLPIQVTHTEM